MERSLATRLTALFSRDQHPAKSCNIQFGVSKRALVIGTDLIWMSARNPYSTPLTLALITVALSLTLLNVNTCILYGKAYHISFTLSFADNL